MNTQIIITKNKKRGYSIQIWVNELKSWLVFDGFKTQKHAKEFLADKKEMAEVKKYIQKAIKGEKALKQKNVAKNKTNVNKRGISRKEVQDKKV
jgi:predicted nuclease with TOPRIM domain